MPPVPPLYKPTSAQLREMPRERAIENFIRGKILAGQLETGAALPAMQDLARVWKSNYFTVHRALTPLVKEGLLARHKGLGTFVAETRRSLQTVGIYYGSDIISDPHHGYAIQLHRLLYQELQRAGLKLHTWMDPREHAESQLSVLPEITRAIETQHIQALITVMTPAESSLRLQRLPLPVAHFTDAVKTHNVYFPNRAFLHRCLERAKETGHRRIALISSPSLLEADQRKHARTARSAFTLFQNLCAREGLRTHKDWFHFIDSGALTREEESERILHAYRHLIAAPRRQQPEAVLIFPDNNLVTLHRALQAEKAGFSPGLAIFSHRNDPLAFPMPEGPHYIALSLDSVARNLVRIVLDASAGLPCPSRPAELVEGPGAPFA